MTHEQYVAPFRGSLLEEVLCHIEAAYVVLLVGFLPVPELFSINDRFVVKVDVVADVLEFSRRHPDRDSLRVPCQPLKQSGLNIDGQAFEVESCMQMEMKSPHLLGTMGCHSSAQYRGNKLA